jgi:hypothetical protein
VIQPRIVVVDYIDALPNGQIDMQHLVNSINKCILAIVRKLEKDGSKIVNNDVVSEIEYYAEDNRYILRIACSVDKVVYDP